MSGGGGANRSSAGIPPFDVGSTKVEAAVPGRPVQPVPALPDSLPDSPGILQGIEAVGERAEGAHAARQDAHRVPIAWHVVQDIVDHVEAPEGPRRTRGHTILGRVHDALLRSGAGGARLTRTAALARARQSRTRTVEATLAPHSSTSPQHPAPPRPHRLRCPLLGTKSGTNPLQGSRLVAGAAIERLPRAVHRRLAGRTRRAAATSSRALTRHASANRVSP